MDCVDHPPAGARETRRREEQLGFVRRIEAGLRSTRDLRTTAIVRQGSRVGRPSDQAAALQAEIEQAEKDNDSEAERDATLRLAAVVEEGCRAVLESLRRRVSGRGSASSDS